MMHRGRVDRGKKTAHPLMSNTGNNGAHSDDLIQKCGLPSLYNTTQTVLPKIFTWQEFSYSSVYRDLERCLCGRKANHIKKATFLKMCRCGQDMSVVLLAKSLFLCLIHQPHKLS